MSGAKRHDWGKSHGLTVRPMREDDADRIALQQVQLIADPFAARTAKQLGARGRSFAVEDGGGRLLFVGGVCEIYPHYGSAWAMLCADKGTAFVTLTRIVRRYLDSLPFDRVDCAVSFPFEAAHRWVAALGFAPDGLHERAAANGDDVMIYVRMRG